MKDVIIIQSIILIKTVKKKISKINLKKILIKYADFMNLAERIMQQIIIII
jgi:hypothetical protein